MTLTAEKSDEAPVPQLNFPCVTPQVPLEVDNVKLEAVPDMKYVARVSTDHVPPLRRPPVVAVIVAFVGTFCGYMALRSEI
jgi:hypothetical protein